MEIKIVFFKDTGKYYTEETVKLPDGMDQAWQIADWLRETQKQHKEMHLVAMLDELDSGVPVLIPAGQRR